MQLLDLLLEKAEQYDKWAYHNTLVKNLKSIATKGLVPSRRDNPGRIWFCASPGDYAPTRKPPTVLLRFPWPSQYKKVWVSPRDPIEFYTNTSNIPSEQLEILTVGGWIGLQTFLNNQPKLDREGLPSTPLVPVPDKSYEKLFND